MELETDNTIESIGLPVTSQNIVMAEQPTELLDGIPELDLEWLSDWMRDNPTFGDRLLGISEDSRDSTSSDIEVPFGSLLTTIVNLQVPISQINLNEYVRLVHALPDVQVYSMDTLLGYLPPQLARIMRDVGDLARIDAMIPALSVISATEVPLKLMLFGRADNKNICERILQTSGFVLSPPDPIETPDPNRLIQPISPFNMVQSRDQMNLVPNMEHLLSVDPTPQRDVTLFPENQAEPMDLTTRINYPVPSLLPSVLEDDLQSWNANFAPVSAPVPAPSVDSHRERLAPEEMSSALDRLFDTLDEDDKTSLAEPTEAIVSPLYPHQKQALHWMMYRENGGGLPPFWKETKSGMYCNTLLNHTAEQRPDSIRGGILADDMGLGKTLQMISLILTNFTESRPLAVPVPGKPRLSKLPKIMKTDADSEAETKSMKDPENSADGFEKIAAIEKEIERLENKPTPETEKKDCETPHEMETQECGIQGERERLEYETPPHSAPPTPQSSPVSQPEKKHLHPKLRIKIAKSCSEIYPRKTSNDVSQDLHEHKGSQGCQGPQQQGLDLRTLRPQESSLQGNKGSTNSTPLKRPRDLSPVLSQAKSPLKSPRKAILLDVPPPPTKKGKKVSPSNLSKYEQRKHRILSCDSRESDKFPNLSKTNSAPELNATELNGQQNSSKPRTKQTQSCIRQISQQCDTEVTVSPRTEHSENVEKVESHTSVEVPYYNNFSPISDCESPPVLSPPPSGSDDNDYDELPNVEETQHSQKGDVDDDEDNELPDIEETQQTQRVGVDDDDDDDDELPDIEETHLVQKCCVNDDEDNELPDTDETKHAQKGDVNDDEDDEMPEIVETQQSLEDVDDDEDDDDELPDIPTFDKEAFLSENQCDEDGRTIHDGPRGTLILCPLSVLSNWQNQFEEHVHPNVHINIHQYYGSERCKYAEQLKQKDVVITTYGTLLVEYKAFIAHGQSLLMTTDWLRVVLDEGHCIRNPNAKQTKAVLSLRAQRKWVLTGTPIQNKMLDLWPLICFLDVKPLTERYWWRSTLEKPLQRGTKVAFKRVQQLMGNISLRRTKAMQVDGKPLVKLPERIVYIERIKMSDEENKLYKTMEEDGRVTIKKYVSRNKLLEKYILVLEIMLRLRQMCCHRCLLPEDRLPPDESDDEDDDVDAKEKREMLQKKLQVIVESEEECSVCVDTLKNPVILPCAHYFCHPCILNSIKHKESEAKGSATCPLCRAAITEEEIIELPPEKSHEPEVYGDWHSSTKVDGLMSALVALREKDKTIKSLVVSQFTSFLTLIQKPLEEMGFQYVRLDGKMSSVQRLETIRKFSETGPNTPTVFLLSLRAGGVGLNLTAASRVFLMEPHWNPATEEQCFDRCHRLGQKNDVIITKFISEGTIEERMLDLQEKKRQLMKKSFKKKQTQQERNRQRTQEIRDLMMIN